MGSTLGFGCGGRLFVELKEKEERINWDCGFDCNSLPDHSLFLGGSGTLPNTDWCNAVS